jgi:DEAD/DEAH box helicase domain-containing protein
VENTNVAEEVAFNLPYQIHYQAPIVKIEVNSSVIKAITDEVNHQKVSVSSQYGDNIPHELVGLFEKPPVAVALHSMAHQIQLAIPLVVLSSTHDVNCLIDREDSNIVAYFYDTTDGGNGASEEIGKHLPLFATKAKSLASTCDCSYGCSKCLIQLGCPQQDERLHKTVGLFLPEAIAASYSA